MDDIRNSSTVPGRIRLRHFFQRAELTKYELNAVYLSPGFPQDFLKGPFPIAVSHLKWFGQVCGVQFLGSGRY